MNTQSSALSDSFEAQRAATAALSATRPLYWSIRRELQENRWIYIGQLAIAAVFVVGALISTVHLPAHMRALAAQDPSQRWEAVAMHYNIAAGVFMATLILMSLFYSAEALHSERRDRSILFWKSLPVSDLTTVLAKASIPLVVLPLLTFAITVAVQVIMLLASSVVLAANGLSVAAYWSDLSPFSMWGKLLHHLLTAHALWPFPVYCWLLLVSAWAKRATLLWAALPIVAIGGVEKLIFNSSHFLEMIGARLMGAGAPIDVTPAGNMMPMGPMTHITPLQFLSTPGLWIGLAVAAAFLAATVQVRRCRGPI
jgi:ABC-2 type transport system permease protein